MTAAARQDAPTAGALLQAVSGTPPVACELVVHALTNRWGGSSVRPRLNLPGAAAPAERALAEWAWSGRPATPDAEPLLAGLADPDGCVRRVAARLLGEVDDPATAARVRQLAATGGGGPARLAALTALGHLDRPEGRATLEAALADPDPQVRLTAAWALGGRAGRASASALGQALRSPDPRLRENAAWALGRAESRDGLDALTAALADPEVGVRLNAAWALGRLEQSAASPALVGLLGTEADAEVRRAVAWALGRIGD